MKRIWIALAILLAMLAGTLGHSFYLASFTGRLTDLLQAAEEWAEQEEWDAARDLTETAKRRWEDHDAYLHVLLRHNETDEIYIGFQEVSELIQSRENAEYPAANTRLIAQLELLSEAEQLNLKNVL